MKVLFVAIGGAIGASLRYLISLIPTKGNFPILTLITNIIGAILIGIIVSYASKHTNISENTVLLLKTGLCGGFTTFSTFSLEALTLYQGNHAGLALLYVVLSFVLCIAGVWIGMKII